MKDLSSTDQELVARVDTLKRHVIALWLGLSTGKPEFVGSGLVLKCSDRFVLVTAAHVADKCTNEIPLFFYKHGDQIWQFNGALQKTSLPVSGKRDDDIYDIAVIEIPKKTIEETQTFTPIDFSRLQQASAIDTGDLFMAVGYPETRAKVQERDKYVSPVPLGYSNRSTSCSDRQRSKGFSESSHIFLQFEKKKVIHTGGGRGPSVDPHGMSGGPIFQFSKPSSLLPKGKELLVGITIEHEPIEKQWIGVGFKPISEMIDRILNVQ